VSPRAARRGGQVIVAKSAASLWSATSSTQGWRTSPAKRLPCLPPLSGSRFH